MTVDMGIRRAIAVLSLAWMAVVPIHAEDPHWAYEPVRVVPAGPLGNQTWSRGPIDRYILHRLGTLRRQPAGAAPAATLLRRVTLDLTGLPPTPLEVASFVEDAAPGVAWLDARTPGAGWALSVEPFDEGDFGLEKGDAFAVRRTGTPSAVDMILLILALFPMLPLFPN